MLIVIDVFQEELVLGLSRHHGLAEAGHAGSCPHLLISHHVASLFEPDVSSRGRLSSH